MDIWGSGHGAGGGKRRLGKWDRNRLEAGSQETESRLPGRQCGWWPLGALCLILTFRIFLLLFLLYDILSFCNSVQCPHAEEKERRHWGSTEVVVRWLACG